MPYITLTDLKTEVPESYLTEALDDDKDGDVDSTIADGVYESASETVDGYLAGRYSVPFSSPYPPLVKRAAVIFACEIIFRRRGVPNEQNPYHTQANSLRKHLAKIRDGEAELALTVSQGRSSGDVISEASKTHSSAGRTSI